MGVQMLHHPQMEILDITDGIDDAAWTKNVSILRKQSRRDDAGLVLSLLKVRVWEEEEEF